MNDDELITRAVKPQAVVMMPRSLKRWLEERADRLRVSQSSIALEAIQQYRARVEADEREEAIA